MSYKYMRIMVFFDLPVDTTSGLKAYRNFRKFLINDGYIMMQESIYTKLVINQQGLNSAYARLKKNAPDSGLIQVLKITEKQFSSIECVSGSFKTNKLNSTDRLVIL